jgi:2-haloacid dehalogenase
VAVPRRGRFLRVEKRQEMRKRRVEALLIDFYGTISAGDREAVEATCADIVAACSLSSITSPAALAIRWGERFFAQIGESNHHAFRTLYECEVDSLRLTLAELGVAPDPEPLVERLEQYWRDPPVYDDAIEFLANVDLPVCCVSNADRKPLLAAIERHKLRFDAVVTSEDARCYKPNAEIFRRAVRALGTDTDALVHVGDSLHSDVGGASSLGIATVWVERDSRIHDIGECCPDWTIASLTGIREILSCLSVK